ncbi:hypothetical protein CsSME_00042073 [Camellia sinensis var. sinensis]
MAKGRQCRNEITSMTFGGSVLEDPSQVNAAIFEHFKKQYPEEWMSRPKLGGLFKSVSSSPYFDVLETEFLESEILAAMKDCDGNKAPGPDGFNMLYFQKFWKVTKGEVLNFMKKFYKNGRLVKVLNSSFITLVPKKENPISLVGSIYKVLTKVLSRRLKEVLPCIISETQSAFIGGRNILDGVLIANEMVDGWKKSKKQGVIIKLDFEKAYDSVNWGFLRSMLLKFGFGLRWVKWMTECVSTARISVLVNGSPTDEFSPQRGLRQGDPLSPFLFNLVVEGLNMLLTRAYHMGIIKEMQIGVDDARLSHLQFADDSILFCEAKEEEVRSLKRILRCFKVMSGLRINYHKSQVCGVGVADESLATFVSILNCKIKKLPMQYLGLPLGADPNRKQTWKPVLDKIRSRLASWKRKLLSYAGRLTLIKSIIALLLVYYLSLFRLPQGVAKVIERLQASFLWGGLMYGEGYTWSNGLICPKVWIKGDWG